jgi:hypothetical protein
VTAAIPKCHRETGTGEGAGLRSDPGATAESCDRDTRASSRCVALGKWRQCANLDNARHRESALRPIEDTAYETQAYLQPKLNLSSNGYHLKRSYG